MPQQSYVHSRSEMNVCTKRDSKAREYLQFPTDAGGGDPSTATTEISRSERSHENKCIIIILPFPRNRGG